jgi:predicted AlkP superfamily pyrophosphatase or phosphodiesterase
MAVPTGAPDRWTLAQRTRASFDAQRSGDLIVLLKRDITPIANPSSGYVAAHGSPWDYDRRVPILFWRPGNKPNDRPDPVATTDIMPTLAAMLGLSVDASKIDGRCLASALLGTCPLARRLKHLPFFESRGTVCQPCDLMR